MTRQWKSFGFFGNSESLSVECSVITGNLKVLVWLLVQFSTSCSFCFLMLGSEKKWWMASPTVAKLGMHRSEAPGCHGD